jgi:hypothetical protein
VTIPRVRLSSYHIGPSGERVEHDVGTLVLGPPRRFVFRFVEENRRTEIAVDEMADGTFGGLLEYPGSPGWGPDRLVVTVGSTGERTWELDVSGKSVHGFDQWQMILYATEIEPTKSPG